MTVAEEGDLLAVVDFWRPSLDSRVCTQQADWPRTRLKDRSVVAVTVLFRKVARSAVAVLAATCLLLPGERAQAQFESSASQAILMDYATGSVLYAKNADQIMYPASMSKLATLAVVFRAIKDGRLSLSDEFVASEYAWRTGGAPSGTSAMFVPINQSVTVEELIQGIAVQSGNDACIIIAEGMSGTPEAFAEVMNGYMRGLGLTRSHFVNSTGLHHPDHVTTARELALLARHIIQEYPEYYHYFGQREFRYRKHLFHNRNPLIPMNLGADGLKTGYTKEAGYGITASAEQEGTRLIAVVNGLPSAKDRADQARLLLDHGFRSFKHFTLFEADETVGDALVYGGTQRYVNLVGRDGVQVLLPRNAGRTVRASIVYNGPLMPPIRKGDQVAVLRVTASESAVTEVPLYAAEDVGVASIWVRGFDSLLHLAFGWIL